MNAIAWICNIFTISTSIFLIVLKPFLVTSWIILLTSFLQLNLIISSKNNESSTQSSNKNNETEQYPVKTEESKSNIWTILIVSIGLVIFCLLIYLLEYFMTKRNLLKYQ
jgi:hypothetical protein